MCTADGFSVQKATELVVGFRELLEILLSRFRKSLLRLSERSNFVLMDWDLINPAPHTDREG